MYSTHKLSLDIKSVWLLEYSIKSFKASIFADMHLYTYIHIHVHVHVCDYRFVILLHVQVHVYSDNDTMYM